MIDVSPLFLQAVRSGGRVLSQAQVTPTHGPAFFIDISGGSVTDDATAQIRGRCDLQISDQKWFPLVDDDPLNVYGAEVQVWRGVEYANSAIELCSRGIFRIQEVDRDTPAGGCSLTGWDRSQQVLDERFDTPTYFGPNTVVNHIKALITDVFSAAVFHTTGLTDTTTTVTPGLIDQDRWPTVQSLALSIGAEVFPDENGEWVIRDVPDPTTATPVERINTGPDGVLVSKTATVTRDGLANAIRATGASVSDDSDPVTALVTDTDTDSPTEWGGPFGKVVRFYDSPLLKTHAQCVAAAAALLAKQKGARRSISFNAAPHPALQAGDCVTISDQDGDQIYIFDQVVVPLDVSSPMTGQTRAQVDVGS